jgi:hypothetical protein
MIEALKWILLLFIAFIPVWAGGQAMRCYDKGQLWRSAFGVAMAVTLNVGLFVLVHASYRYNWSIVTILPLLSF